MSSAKSGKDAVGALFGQMVNPSASGAPSSSESRRRAWVRRTERCDMCGDPTFATINVALKSPEGQIMAWVCPHDRVLLGDELPEDAWLLYEAFKVEREWQPSNVKTSKRTAKKEQKPPSLLEQYRRVIS